MSCITCGTDLEDEDKSECGDCAACPGCGCKPGDGLTASCDSALGCGFWRQERERHELLKKMGINKRIEAAAAEAEDAFFRVLAEHFPEVRPGDFDPNISKNFSRIVLDVTNAWYDYNKPKPPQKYKVIVEVEMEGTEEQAQDLLTYMSVQAEDRGFEYSMAKTEVQPL